MGSDLAPLLQGMLPALLLAGVAWLASLPTRDASLVDRFWSWVIMAPALYVATRVPAIDARAGTMLALGLLWALRLSVYVSWRNWGHGEDRRYAAIRARNQPGFAVKSLYLVFGLQAVLAWIVALPLMAGLMDARPWRLLDGLGLILALAGIACEALADAQLARFRARPANQGRVMDGGLWRIRHPNYFGEACLWWGLWLMAPGPWTLLSPALMTFLLLRVSGVALLEKDIAERRPEYLTYLATTNAFFPGPPRKASP